MKADELHPREAVALALAAQRLDGGRRRPAHARSEVLDLVRELGAVQLDTISVLARSHELINYARLGAIGRNMVEDGLWGGGTFEYWAHAASVVALELWPWFAARRRQSRSRYIADQAHRELRTEVLARLADLGPVTIGDLGGARIGNDWWQWSPTKTAVEQLLAMGDVVCTRRRAWRRVYDLPERAVPAELLALEPTDEECWAQLCRRAVSALGVATTADIADYYRLTMRAAVVGIETAALTPVTVSGWAAPAFLSATDGVAAPPRASHRSVLLSPFDSLIWNRPRTLRLFDFSHRLEAYTPAAKRVHGYFVMPLLHRGRLRGRVDPKRVGDALVVRTLSVDKGAERAMAAALAEAAPWVGARHVVLQHVDPPAAAAKITTRLTELGFA